MTDIFISEFDLVNNTMKFVCEYCGVEFQDFPCTKRRFCSQSCFMKWRNKQNPELRFSGKTKNHFAFNKICIDYIDGLLLSDACVKNPRTKSRWATRLTQTFSQRFEEWAKQIKNDLMGFGINSKLTPYSYIDKRTGKTYYGISLQTKMYPEFMVFYKRWYPDGKKEIPNDIRLTSSFLTNWFLGDGSRPHGNLQLSTENFDEKSINFLRGKLETIGLFFHKTKSGRLALYNKEQTQKFLSLMREVPSCFDYKIGGDETQ